MAGNALPLVLLAGAAFLLTRKKGEKKGFTADDLPADQGQGASDDEPSSTIPGTKTYAPDEDNPNIGFDATANMPFVETIDDYQAWKSKLEQADPMWIGSSEFIDMDEELAEVGKFIEQNMSVFGNYVGRTVDRSELDPVAADAMMADNPIIEEGLANLFAGNPGLEGIIFFTKPDGQTKLAAYLIFSDATAQQTAVTNIAALKQFYTGAGVDTVILSGYRGMQGPSLFEAIKAFLNANLPKGASIGGLTETMQGSLSP